MSEIVRAPSAVEAVVQIGSLSDDDLDLLISKEEELNHIIRLARVERGRRHERHIGGRGKTLTPGVSLSGFEMKARSEERIVAKWYDQAIGAAGFLAEHGWRKCVTEARNKGYGKQRVRKKKLKSGVSHPARFSDPLLEAIDAELPTEGVVLDPFAGTGRIHEVATATRRTVGVEIEPEWASEHEQTQQGNVLDLFGTTTVTPESVDAIATSPTYGNRLADSHKASDPDTRRSYTHDLGHALHPDNSGQMQWGVEYRDFHLRAYDQMVQAMKPGAVFVLNVSDHIRDGELQGVPLWHVGALMSLGLVWENCRVVGTNRLKQGSNSELRDVGEYVVRLRRPS